ncbi:Amino acid permease-associated region [Tepidanaerobacter acetatoxydans Re1]|uniref:Amino acid permease-associated region n=1 Tax=Tepidanaerobacter acetatoxydans (strain DSM 21804 / JCM 16047 / Re1) TaxID=1209989 RepID=F4LT80_TEPAE|nr:APC family permease [Tepidanaerobacter acetatoxydans]AEE92480.1 amino acid permease-associated region [Tepidanaerobacter acetatoxydans Re1]CDI41025.1 Amino acid permease-associated region [Tepidanaerobacter acetatoxydans Re1]
MSDVSVSTKDLNRVLGRWDLMAMAVGQIIGAGIMSMTGIAIGMTGKSVFWAFLIAAVFVLIQEIPVIILGGTVRMRGGNYTQIAFLTSPKWAGMYIITYIVSNISIAMYALSFADYFLSLIPGAPHKLVSAGIMTLFFITNYFGIQQASKLQNIMVVVLATALAVFTGFGLPKVQPGFFSEPYYMTSGVLGLLSTAAFLTFATGGASIVLNYGAEAKNPVKDIPFVIVVSTVCVAFLYGLMSIVAAGVLPVPEVANQPLTVVAAKILPKPLYVFFIVCGALFALTTTLNSQIGGITKPVLQACIDGWFPKTLGKLHPKYKTPVYLLLLFYIVGILPILTGWDIGFVGNIVLFINRGFLIVLSISIVRLPKVIPEIWERSKFHVSNGMLWFFAIVSAGINVVQTFLLARNISKAAVIGNLCIFAFAIAYGFLLEKKVTMEISYEES